MNNIDPQKEAEKIVRFLQQTMKDAGFTNLVIGISGGVDSAVSCALGVAALGADHVYPVLLPYGALNTRGVLDAMEFIQQMRIPMRNIVRIDIKPAVDTMIKNDSMMDRVRRGNIMARIRMAYLFDQAKKHTALVLGTENKSEYLLGYFTRFGDDASDIEPVRHLYKTQVYELARYLQIPDAIIEKPPSADLWPEQTDEGEFGFTYKEADQILFYLFEEKKSLEDVVSFGFSKGMVTQVQIRTEKNSFKRKTPMHP